eukprot:CAMPEP_0117496530 /NCGR_PEP_ID=MMETSP0784-20121206/20705_1 /TAXON_ID=39447 /ORGANISM="" /LENGTH=532 /DNA_ID=CAMNT_0005291505 /DNA_START=48 /DNA_END=1647 /DNA_ORIENTATION=+
MSCSEYELLDDIDALEPHYRSTHGKLSAISSCGESFMVKVKRMERVAQNEGIMRAVPIIRILAGFARCFAPPESSMPFQEVGTPMAQKSHDESDVVFTTAEPTMHLDYFVSHVWAATRYQKYLALLYHANLRIAVTCAVITWLFSVWLLLHQYDYALASFGGVSWGMPVTARVVFAPVAVFYSVFFLGHKCPRRRRDMYWVDKLCIHQTRTDLKHAGIDALPEFVANSNRLLLLWSDQYFERLWCNAEVATFCAVNGSARAIDFQPLWLAPWVLTTIGMDVISIILLSKFTALVPIVNNYFAGVFGHGTSGHVFFGQMFGIGLCMGLSYMPASIPNYYSFTAKLEQHAAMMAQLSSYSLDQAKCAVEEDRAVVEKHIKLLFGECPELGKDAGPAARDPIGRFNHFMQVDLRYACSDKIGLSTRIPYGISQLVFLPLIFEAVANILNCDGFDCTQGAVAEGYSSALVFMMTNATNWFFGVFLVYPTTYSLMLLAMDYLRTTPMVGGVQLALWSASLACISRWDLWKAAWAAAL